MNTQQIILVLCSIVAVAVMGVTVAKLTDDPLRDLIGHHWCDHPDGYSGFVSYRFRADGSFAWNLHTDYPNAEHGTGRWAVDAAHTLVTVTEPGTVTEPSHGQTSLTIARGRPPVITRLRGSPARGIVLLRCDQVPGD